MKIIIDTEYYYDGSYNFYKKKENKTYIWLLGKSIWISHKINLTDHPNMRKINPREIIKYTDGLVVGLWIDKLVRTVMLELMYDTILSVDSEESIERKNP